MPFVFFVVNLYSRLTYGGNGRPLRSADLRMHLYVHVPYCAKKCPYCDFNSHAGRDEEHAAYVDALLTELRRLPRGAYDTIFIGGGTPTLLAPALLARLLEGMREHIALADGYEWTCEANPGSSDAERFGIMAEHGVNRISIGVQALQSGHLRFLGRVHDADEAHGALEAARAAVPRVSADLIIGLPEQSDEELAENLALYRRHGLDHASVYHLTIEPGTEFAARLRRGELRLAPADRGGRLLELAWELLAADGLDAYETSNFAAAGGACRHNLAYWRQRDYHAAGAGAVSTLGRERCTRERNPGRYIRALAAGGDAIVHRERLDDAAWLAEAWMLGLRLCEGVDEARLAELGDAATRWQPIVAGLAQEGLIMRERSRIRLSAAGRLVQDAVTVALLP